MTTTVIRMGASHWDATIPTNDGEMHFDFRKMTKEERRQFHSHFMAAYRQARKNRRKKQ